MKQIKRFPRGLLSPSPQNLSEGGNGEAERSSIDPDIVGRNLKKLIDDSTKEDEDPEIRDEIKAQMDEILRKRIEEKTQNFEQNVLGNSLQVIKSTKMRLQKASLHTLNELIDEFLSSDEKNDISPLL